MNLEQLRVQYEVMREHRPLPGWVFGIWLTAPIVLPFATLVAAGAGLVVSAIALSLPAALHIAWRRVQQRYVASSTLFFLLAGLWTVVFSVIVVAISLPVFVVIVMMALRVPPG
ncbi:MAG: hypothetical protein AAGK09_14385 [Planctomycetota bacterium]